MVAVHQEGNTVFFTIEGWHKLWSFRSELRIPRANITSARHDPEAARTWGFRAPGTHIPGLLKAGTFYLVDSLENAIVVELADEQFARLIIEVADPAATVALLNGRAG
jgi:hypothetical protein